MSDQDRNVIGVADNDARMNAAMAKARSTVRSFIEALESSGPGVSELAVKIRLQDGSNIEHVWVKDVSYKGELFHGIVNNQPTTVACVKVGDRVTARPDEISDWMFVRGRTLVGGYTIRAVRDGLSAEEREAFDRSSPFLIEAAGGGTIQAPAELIGTWNLVSVDAGAGPIPRRGIRMRITERSIEMLAPFGARKSMGEIAGTNPTTTPNGIDLSNGGRIGRGIYEVNGDELKLIVSDPGQLRPTRFEGRRIGMLFVLKRRRSVLSRFKSLLMGISKE